ncbi:cytochrome c [bacterium]|nr:cytochrome c [bacterium]
MKVSYRWVFAGFGLVFAITAVILYFRVVQNVQDSAVVVANTPNPTQSPATVAHLGEILYVNQCASCHGGKGQGLVALGPSLIHADWAFDEDRIGWLIERIKAGGNGMPPFKGRLRHDDIVRIVQYIETLNQAAASQRAKEGN